MIENLTYRGRTLVFSSPESRALQHIFNVDSFTLLIGSNGSGKTTLLSNAAVVLAEGAQFGDEGNYSVLTSDGEPWVRDTRHAPNGYGVVYYTALPYRKPMKTRGRLINASPPRNPGKDKKSIELLRDIAHALNTKARLFGRVTYRPDFAAKMLIPALIEAEVKFHDETLHDLYSTLRQEQYIPVRKSLFSGNASEPDSGFERVLIEQWNNALTAFEHHLTEKTCDALDQRGTFFRAISLASLEAAFEHVRPPGDLALFMLHDCGLIYDDFHWRRHGGIFTEIRDATARYITNENGDIRRMNREHPDRIEFEITTDAEYTRLLVEDTAIKLDWLHLSSGMLALVEQFARLDQAIERLKNKGLRKILLFVDEGDAFLHLEWQRKYIDLLNGYLGQCAARHELESLQVVLATHSPILAGDVPSSMIQSLDQDQLHFKTFGATLDDIILRSFLSNSIGEFAAKHIRRLHAAVTTGNLSEKDRLLLEQIGDPVLKREVLSDRRGDHDR